MLGFQPYKVHSMLAFMLDPRYKELGLVIDYFGKELALRIVGKYDREVLFSFLVCAYKVENPSNNVKEPLVVLHPKILKPLVCMIAWIRMRTWLYR
jgi:hypothetical protein